MTLTFPRIVTDAIGRGDWVAQIAGRGGSPVYFEVPWDSLGPTRQLNQTGRATVTVPMVDDAGTTCCEILREVDPWKHELLLWRNGALSWVGPVLNVSISAQGGQIQAQDLSYWLEQRFIGDFHGDGDAGDVFRAIFEHAMAGDESPNIELTTRRTGVQTTQDFKEVEFHRAADALRDLATYGVDWTTVGRRVLAGGKEVFLPDTPLMLHDEGVIDGELVKEGSSLATDVAIFGATLELGTKPVSGRATTNTAIYGLIQRSFTQLLVRDNIAADAAALARLEAMQPSPMRLKVELSPEAAFGYNDLIPGRRVDVHLRESIGCIEMNDTMRLHQVTTRITTRGESVEVDLVPLGVISDA